MLAGKKFHLNEEVTTETEAHFEEIDKSFYISGIEMMEIILMNKAVLNKKNFHFIFSSCVILENMLITFIKIRHILS